MIIVGEEGTPVVGNWVEVDENTPMLENEIYEFYYDVYTLGERWPLDKIRAFVLSKFTELVAKIRGLEVIYWKLTDTELVWQGKGTSTSPTWREVTLATVAIGAQGLLLTVGVIIALRAVFRSIPLPLPSPKKWWWAYLLGGLAFLAIIFGIGYAKGKEKSK